MTRYVHARILGAEIWEKVWGRMARLGVAAAWCATQVCCRFVADVMQCVAMCCDVLQFLMIRRGCRLASHAGMLQVYCGVLRCVAVFSQVSVAAAWRATHDMYV